jgi:tRNA nucleotidyltransferase (CCA-adding enzyme)
MQDEPYPQRARLQSCLNAALSVVTEKIAQEALSRGVIGPDIGQLIHTARVAAVQEVLQRMGAVP